MKINTGRSIKESLSDREPKTNYFFEQLGSRAVSISDVLLSGGALLGEQININLAHDNRYIWDCAIGLLEGGADTELGSHVEWLRYQIIVGSIVPPQWKEKKAFPYKGLLLAAIYLQEAEREILRDNEARAWHLVTTAHYFLGMNTSRDEFQNSSRAAVLMHSRRTEGVRALVLGALIRVQVDNKVKSLERAKDAVVARIEIMAKSNASVKASLDEFDQNVSRKTKGRGSDGPENDVFERIRNLLDDWASLSGPYPQVAEAFQRFLQGIPISISDSTAKVDGIEADFYLRFISWRAGGRELIVTIKSDEKVEDAGKS